ncbi:DUF6155 family protein [Fredinandcohnia sp. 179-A 10B2 NHS]|uniref:DUF6155 family protein n=1 Tax=Fredinandcohnia sp. 179-A 10B2 NHS TaxID=3235176 RepID=UPI0039A2E089
MSKLNITELKKSLKQLEQKELIQLVADLYKLNSDVKDYLSSKFGGEEVALELYNKAKKKIQDEFYPDRGLPKLRLSEAKQAISDFKKSTGNSSLVADLMLLYVELGTEFSREFGVMETQFYNSMVFMYDKVAEECENNEELYNLLKERLYSCVSMSEEGDWGYNEALIEIYYNICWVQDEEE